MIKCIIILTAEVRTLTIHMTGMIKLTRDSDKDINITANLVDISPKMKVRVIL